MEKQKIGVTRKKLRDIAEGEGIEPYRFMQFITRRFPAEQDEHYIREWADRFRSGSMFAHADSKSLAILKDVFGVR